MKALSKIIGVSDGTICKWENDVHDITIDYLKKLAIYFDVSADYLLGLED